MEKGRRGRCRDQGTKEGRIFFKFFGLGVLRFGINALVSEDMLVGYI
jgi:hypothetical protein